MPPAEKALKKLLHKLMDDHAESEKKFHRSLIIGLKSVRMLISSRSRTCCCFAGGLCSVPFETFLLHTEFRELLLMRIDFRKADLADAELLISIYNSSFYSDYIKYGECPAYGRTKEMMEQSIIDYPKFLIICDSRPVGCISCKETEKGIYEVGCLCVVPEYQGKGIGTAAMEFAKTYYHDWNRFTLITPADKSENVRFYTEKCGFEISSVETDGNVKVVRFILERQKR